MRSIPEKVVILGTLAVTLIIVPKLLELKRIWPHSSVLNVN